MPPKDFIVLTGLKVACIIGIFDWERKRKQDVLIDLKFPIDVQRAAETDRIEDACDYKRIAKATIAFVEKSGFQLVETLAERLAGHLLENFGIYEVSLKVSKPGAIRGSQNVGVEITRSRKHPSEPLVHLSLGSNIHPAIHLSNALKILDEKFGVVARSHIYETSPVGGVKGQPPFWNMVIAIKTKDAPEKLKKWIGILERNEGRTRVKNRYAARTLDVDLVCWGDRIVRGRKLKLPHPDIQTKAFVLFPLLEIAPDLVIPGISKPLIEIAAAFTDKSQKIRRLSIDLINN